MATKLTLKQQSANIHMVNAFKYAKELRTIMYGSRQAHFEACEAGDDKANQLWEVLTELQAGLVDIEEQ